MEETRRLILSDYPSTNVEIGEIDVANENAVAHFFQSVVNAFGRIDFAANVAGYAHKAVQIIDLAESEYDKSYAVNQKGAWGTSNPRFLMLAANEDTGFFL